MKAKYVKPTVEMLCFLTEEIATVDDPTMGGLDSSFIGDGEWNEDRVEG